MTDDSDPVGSADLLQRRFRSFVARPVVETPASERSEADDDLPVLTEIVASDSPRPAVDAVAPTSVHGAIEDTLSRWLDEALPNASQQLIAALYDAAHRDLLPQLLEKLEHGTRQKL